MTIKKIQAGRITTVTADEYVGESGTIFYNESLGDLRLSDGETVGGIPLNVGDGTPGSGTDGTNGTNGTDGADGTNGTNGADGIQGNIGATGEQGIQGPAGLDAPPSDNTTRIDFYTDDIIYRGEAIPASIESDPVWRIEKIEFDVNGDVSKTWASGTSDYDKVWDNRLLYEYL